MSKKFVKVISCKDPKWWYANNTGSYYPLVRVQKDGSYIVEHGSRNSDLKKVKACIAKEDGVVYASKNGTTRKSPFMLWAAYVQKWKIRKW